MTDPDDLPYPSEDLAKITAVQAWLFENIFDEERHPFAPHARYRFRVLKKVISIIEDGFEDGEEDEISDDLMSCFVGLVTLKAQAEIDIAQQVSNVTYTLPSSEENPPVVKLVEKQAMVGTGTDTGLRTWTAALFLATYLCDAGRNMVKGKSIIELGGGAGLLSILCGTHLAAKSVLITDFSQGATELAQYNIDLNDASSIVQTALLQWGVTSLKSILPTGDISCTLDMILAADIAKEILSRKSAANHEAIKSLYLSPPLASPIKLFLTAHLYDPKDIPALIRTLAEIFGTNPKIQFLLAHTVRSEETLNNFLDSCEQRSWHIEQLEVARVPDDKQTGFFHASWSDELVNIYMITQGTESTTSVERKLCIDAQEFLDSIDKDAPKAD
ncbi:MAG: hypothetical protein Q9183_004391 [Haloplaca sp. 2 TL-2023]